MVLIIVHHFYRIFRRRTLGSRWPLKLHNKVPLYSCIFSIIFCETSRTTDYILTAKQRRAWSWESVSNWKRQGEKFANFNPQSLENLQNLLPRFSVYKQVELIFVMLFVSSCSTNVILNSASYLSGNAMQTTLTVTTKFIPKSTIS